jgi:glycerol uptake facilitator-like aquaporin
VTSPLARSLAAETVGSALLLATVVGSGIMAERLAGGNVALALLGNTLATGAMLVVLIEVFGPVSGAHFNPAVSLVFVVRGELPRGRLAGYIGAQVAGALLGVATAHAMFDEPLLQVSSRLRTGPSQWLSELVATFGLIVTILGTSSARPPFLSIAVGLYITAAYWFTASTSFANPAVTFARSLSDTFSGIAPAHAPAFMLAQLIGALGAAAFAGWLFDSRATSRNARRAATPPSEP